ncbi:MAG: Outer membrane lipoprotein Omp16 [Alphaproteobacteria bacterium MarineAlpha9_Bin2]|nr:MAG: Outer membrane lipoprotein Omp16 [Alphaproteobacteria bacterium MarineAlpha9_Bin2]
MPTYLKVFMALIIFAYMQGCAKEHMEDLVLNAEGRALSQDEEGSSSTEIEVEENIAQKIEMDDVETITQRLTNELIEVGDRVFFDYDQSVIMDEGQETLLNQAQFLNKNTDILVTVTGHCDERGTREYNLALGERRASSVKNYLVSLGIDADRISIISYGKEKPSVAGYNDWAWSQNRTAITLINN